MRRLNLNLVYSLNAILTSPTLTEAGRKVGLSQPAMSLALARIRAHFDDEVVLFQNGIMRQTALGEALRARVTHFLHVADGVFCLNLEFDPTSQVREIRLAAPEPIEIVFLSRVARRLLGSGPGISVRFLPFDQQSSAALFDHGADMAIVPEAMLDSTFSHVRLFDQDLVCLVCETSRFAGRPISAADYAAARHVALSPALEQSLTIVAGAAPLGERRVVARTEHFVTLPNLVAGTDLIITATDWLAQFLASTHPVRTATPPFTGQTAIYAQWERWRDDEPLIGWLKSHLQDAAKTPVVPS